MKRVLAITVVLIVIIAAFTGIMLTQYNSSHPTGPPQAYVGVTYCGNTVEGGKQLIDKVKGYTNLFVLQSGLLQRDFASVDQLGDYAVNAGLYFLPYFGNFVPSTFSTWLDSAKQKWGSHLLGVYYGDEAGGKMLDDYVDFKDQATGDSITKTKYGDVVVEKPNGIVINYQLDETIRLYEPASADDPTGINNEATFYPNGTVTIVKPAPNGFSYETYQQLADQKPFKDADETAQRFLARDQTNIAYLNSSVKVFTSDYALYWFDYQSGYDVVLGQVGWNLSLSQQIGLMRGAAATQNKDWGVVITWKYQKAPYLATGPEILSQMKTAYECGAKYFVLFNYYDDSDSNPYGTLQPEHFEALQSFWNQVVNNSSEVQGSVKADSVLVLPKNYGSGMRWDGDKTWGIFLADEKAAKVWDNMQNVLHEHGLKTDIVYEDANFSLSSYQNVFYWNSSISMSK